MSTIPKPDRSAASPRRSERIKSPKTTSPSAKTVAGPPGASKPLASLKYGWRDVPKKLADGRIKVERVPLTLDDVVHPQFGDVHVLSDAHDDDCSYMKDVLKDRYRDNSQSLWFQSARPTQYLHGCWPMSRMLHAWITFIPRASARATSSGDSEPGLSQTSPAGFRARASISLRPILGGT